MVRNPSPAADNTCGGLPSPCAHRGDVLTGPRAQYDRISARDTRSLLKRRLGATGQ